MKRIGALICLIVITMCMLAPASFAANNSADSGFKIDSSTPADNATGVSVENLSVKIYFSKEVLPDSSDSKTAKAIRKANAKAFKLTDNKGNKIPISVYYSHKEKKDGLLMVVSDTIDSDITIKGDTEYTLTIGKNLQATDGTKLGKTQTITFRTLDQSKSTRVYTIMMVVMIVGMIFFTSRSAKKAAEKEQQEKKGKTETVNPYKEAKRTGKSVEEIVEKDQKRKAKLAEAEAKKKEKEAKWEAEELAREKAAHTKKVSARRPISAAGSTYKHAVKVQKPAEQKHTNKGTTNPKNQSAKQKNKQKNKKK